MRLSSRTLGSQSASPCGCSQDLSSGLAEPHCRQSSPPANTEVDADDPSRKVLRFVFSGAATADEDGRCSFAVARRWPLRSRATLSQPTRAFTEPRRRNYLKGHHSPVRGRSNHSSTGPRRRCGKAGQRTLRISYKRRVLTGMSRLSSNVATCAYSSRASAVSARPRWGRNWPPCFNIGFSTWTLKQSVSSECRLSVFEAVT